jgi:hypothetical protein
MKVYLKREPTKGEKGKSLSSAAPSNIWNKHNIWVKQTGIPLALHSRSLPKALCLDMLFNRKSILCVAS